MAAEALTEPTVQSDTATQADPPEPARSRRSILGAGLTGLAGLVLGSLGRPAQAQAVSGGSLVLGAANGAGASNTSLTTASSGTALLVTQTGSGTALRGSATALNGIAGFFTSANGPGVSGVTASNTKYAVYGGNNAASYGGGAAMRAAGEQNHGLVASTASTSAFAIKATNTNAGTDWSAGSAIRALASGATDADVVALATYPAAGEFYGASGVVAAAKTPGGYGVYGFSDSGNGLYGASISGDGVYCSSTSSYGLYCFGAARVYGDLAVLGTLSKGGGSFKIDHPLDPANKFLYHSFVESPDMKNVYDGVVTLDASGEATVTLPDWFEALNRDTRIQLTAVGEFSPLYVKSKVQAGAFSIGGGKAGQEVYWQLTGIRQDAWANAHRIPVEEEKPTAERGLYLHPTVHGQPADEGIEQVRNAAMRPHVRK
jgi:hypothetical protein